MASAMKSNCLSEFFSHTMSMCACRQTLGLCS